MKKKYAALAMLTIGMATAFAGCGKTPAQETTEPPPQVQPGTEENYAIRAKRQEVTIHEDDLNGYAFDSLFSATLNGQKVKIDPSWLDLSAIAEGEDGVVTCAKGEASASVTVHVRKAVYEIFVRQESMEIFPARAEKYDYLSLFTCTRDGKPYPLTEDMATSEVQKEVGSYRYTVQCGGAEKSLTVNVVAGHYLEVVNSYPVRTVAPGELAAFDATELFTLYVDDEIVRVTEDMVDASALEGGAAGQEYTVSFSYATEDGISSIDKTCTVRVQERAQAVLTHRDAVTYPNSAILDLTTLFTVTVEGEEVPVTPDMISGEVNYTVTGSYPVTLTYGGQQEVATVRVESGVVIRHKRGATVEVKKGTDKALYDFGADFEVVIGGVLFDNVNFCVDSSAVDFTKAGEYTATISIDYNTAKLLMNTPPAFDGRKEETITYKVVENEYVLRVKEERVTLPSGTQSYNFFNNVELFVNGMRNTITDRRDWVIVNVVYGKLVSDADFTKKGVQTVRLAIYVNGIGADEASDSEPVVVSYELVVGSGVTVTAHDASIFSGTTFFTRDLFTIRENGQEVAVTEEYVSGYVDVFTPGIYPVLLDYDGVTAAARVVVYDREMLGTYHTRLRTFARPYTGSLSEDYDDEATFVSKRLGDLIFTERGLLIGGEEYTLGAPIDERTFEVSYRYTKYTLHYEDGIVVLLSENAYNMQLIESTRPLIYFNEAAWENDKAITITYSTAGTYVLSSTTSGNYSIDAFRLVSKKDGTEKWYALYTKLVTKMNSDWFYEIDHGEIRFAEGFDTKTGVRSTAELNGVSYAFEVRTATLAVIERERATTKYAGLTFTGTVGGRSAELSFNAYQHLTLKVGGAVVIASLTGNEIDAMKNGGYDYERDEIFIYEQRPESGKSIYSYYFVLDVNARTFTLREQDGCLGKYAYGDKYIFLDGYGSGHVCFDTKTPYQTTVFDYVKRGNEIVMTYRDTLANFAYGTGAEFYLAPLGNVLTVRSFADKTVPDTAAFTNEYVTDGAIIRYLVKTIAVSGEEEAKSEIFRNIEIVTSEGTLTGSALRNSSTVSVELDRIQYSTEGFYRLRIKVPYHGSTVTVDYAVQVVSDRYASSPVAKNYGTGVVSGNASLSIGKNGLASVSTAEGYFSGYAIISGSDFVISARSIDGKTVHVEGTMLREGLIRARGEGDANFNDYFTTGTVRFAGGDGELRVIALDGGTAYLYTDSVGTLGAVYGEEDVTLLSGDPSAAGCVLAVGGDVVKVVSWGDREKGLRRSDAYRGTYEAEGEGATLVIDGFGALTLGGAAGSYVLHDSNRATIIVGSDVKIYRLSKVTGTYRVLDYPLDNSILREKKMESAFDFTVDGTSYRAIMTVEFKRKGVVNVHSFANYADYTPVVEGEGTYEVSGNTVTVRIKGYTLSFLIPDVMLVTKVVLSDTNVPPNAEGYFGRGTVFTLVEESSSSGGSSSGGGSSSSGWGDPDDWCDWDWDD